MIMLNDLLRLSEDELKNTKIRFNQYNGEDNPLDKFKKNPKELERWNYYNSQRYKIGQLSIGLVKMNCDEWLLFTVGKITGIKDIPFNSGVGYEYETLNKLYGDLFGRVVIKYHKTMQSQFPNAKTVIDDLIVKEILPSVFSDFDFPGYDRVSLTYDELKDIIDGKYPSYKNALKNQQAVYVLTDTNTGMLYVGSATSKNEMLLSRWRGYIDKFHNGNEGLKKLYKKEGKEYFRKYFKYSIIENFNAKVNPDFVLSRETYWKNVLDTKKHGYNEN